MFIYIQIIKYKSVIMKRLSYIYIYIYMYRTIHIYNTLITIKDDSRYTYILR